MENLLLEKSVTKTFLKCKAEEHFIHSYINYIVFISSQKALVVGSCNNSLSLNPLIAASLSVPQSPSLFGSIRVLFCSSRKLKKSDHEKRLFRNHRSLMITHLN